MDGKQWLVGDKMTFADLAFSTWNQHIDSLLSCEIDQRFDGFPNVGAWHERITSRPAWKHVMELRANMMSECGIGRKGLPEGINNMEEYEAYLKEHADDNK